jgi:hypothetical protein
VHNAKCMNCRGKQRVRCIDRDGYDLNMVHILEQNKMFSMGYIKQKEHCMQYNSSNIVQIIYASPHHCVHNVYPFHPGAVMLSLAFILQDNSTYKDALGKLMLSTLSVRREKLCVKFATKKLCQE